MLDKLIPWKKRGGDMSVQNDDHPIARLRQDFDHLWERFWDDWKSGSLGPWDDSRWFGSRLDLDDNGASNVLRGASRF